MQLVPLYNRDCFLDIVYTLLSKYGKQRKKQDLDEKAFLTYKSKKILSSPHSNQLVINQLIIMPMTGAQFVMGTLFDNPAFMQNDYLVGMTDGA